MGSAKKQNKSYRTRTTRSSGRSNLLSSDPLQNTALLNTQLRTLGLYAAPTLGDGNCLFRALSDQYYGSPSRHVEVRREICDFIEGHPERYEGFVDVDEFGDSGVRKDKGSKLGAYVAGMRQNATYGGHMELSAFAHLTKRNIKVVQPGLVYVIQCDPQQPKKSPSKKPGGSPSKNTRFASLKEAEVDGDASMSLEDEQDSTIYVAYHDWEHFSSVRNLRGPHTGPPCVREIPPPPNTGSSSSASPPPDEHLPPSKARKKERERKEKERKELGRLKAKEKTANPSKGKGGQDSQSSSSTQPSTGFKLKIPPRPLPPPTLSMTAATPISAAVSPLSSLPPSPTEEAEDFLDAATVPLPTSAPPSVATSPPVSHSPSPAPGTGSDQPCSDPEDSAMGSPSADLSTTVVLSKSPPPPESGSSVGDPFNHGLAAYPHSFISYPYLYAHFAHSGPPTMTRVHSYPSLPATGLSTSSASASTSQLPPDLSKTDPIFQDPSASSNIYSGALYAHLPANAVAIDPLSHLSHLTHLIPPPRVQRSPKRSFEESEEGSAESGPSTSSFESKRSRMEDLSENASESRGRQDVKMEDSLEPTELYTLPSLNRDESTDADDGHQADDAVEDPLEPSNHSSQGSDSSEESDKDHDGDDDDDYVDEEDEEDEDADDLAPNLNHSNLNRTHGGRSNERPLTRRQRKKLGLPKPRSNLVVSNKGAGKILIPGGKSSRASSREAKSAEWTANGSGRVDYRGFRELKI
ncbi:hypothetical protein BDP27DRAFT_1412280 [Rhodocollybia butyracea]|uniref:OTU domain-containing protein n=1 Tax=Rhodocollybia butyracea TaxID=206335 RepID=A0A9P5Q553_9AGAR|nr:hypothetical protein BDP27DRAFT_1412280 [Rhodocollybia butyracea]